MQLLINIPKYYYENNIKNDLPIYLPEDNIIAILPMGHGRLKDTDAICKDIISALGICDENYLLGAEKAIYKIIKNATTIIEADTESEE